MSVAPGDLAVRAFFADGNCGFPRMLSRIAAATWRERLDRSGPR